MSQLASLLLADLPALADPQVSADRLASRAVVALPVSVDGRNLKSSHDNRVTSAIRLTLRQTNSWEKQYALAHKGCAPIESGRWSTAKATFGYNRFLAHLEDVFGAVWTVHEALKAAQFGCCV